MEPESWLVQVVSVMSKVEIKLYCLGFAIFQDHVLLIKKKRPEFQRDKLNGIGGKIEMNETPIKAMVREFKEETGIATVENNWGKFGQYDFGGGYIHLFRSFVIDIFKAKSVTDEEVIPVNLSRTKIEDLNVLENLKFLVPAARFEQPLYLDIFNSD